MIFFPRKGNVLPVFLFPLLAAAAARVLISYEWMNSPLRYYHTVDGLDMKGLLDMGEAFYKGLNTFNIYNSIVALSYYLNGETHQVEFIVVLQFLCGCLTTLLIAYIVLKISGSRPGAIIAGCAAGLYLPELIYETQILKETLYLLLACSGFAVILKARSRNFSVFAAFFAGVFAFMPSLLRVSGILAGVMLSLLFGIFILKKFKAGVLSRRRALLVLSFYLVGAVPVIAVFSGIYLKDGPSPFLGAASYYIEKGSELSPTTLSTIENSIKKPYFFVKYPMKLRDLFGAFEISNNMNYYFVKGKFPLGEYLPGPLLLLPLGLCGLIIMLFRHRLQRKEGLYFVYLFSYGLPILAFVPLARYRIVLLPIFCAGAAYFIIYFLNCLRTARRQSWLGPGALVLLYIFVLWWSIPRSIPLRSEDFTVYGQAVLARRVNMNEAELCFWRAYELNPGSRSVVICLAAELSRKGKYPEAEAVLHSHLKENPGDPKCTVNLAVLYNTMVRPDLAEKTLLAMSIPADPRGKTIYYYNLGVSYMLQGRKADADSSFKKALETVDKSRAGLIMKAIEFNAHNKRP
ncbi:MAG: hypothetical protein A2020_13235 [Lentisphaerae bacterium GWF2_45_14]|nr:MAG: hypothetical protein A2020_13235 [Lentisphaerae bacterium GWF2_45_14]